MVTSSPLNKDVSVVLDTTKPPFAVHGIYQGEWKDCIVVKGTVGDNIGRLIAIPKSRIVTIDWKE